MTDEKKTIKFQMMLSEKEMEAIEDWRFENRVNSRAEAIRRLCVIGLNTSDGRESLGHYFTMSTYIFRIMNKLLEEKLKDDDEVVGLDLMIKECENEQSRVSELILYTGLAQLPPNEPNEAGAITVESQLNLLKSHMEHRKAKHKILPFNPPEQKP